MPHLHRFHVPFAPQVGDAVDLSPEEAHHALHVVRLREGDDAALFDGRGHEWLGKVVLTTRREVTVGVREERVVEPPRHALTLVQAWLKRDKCMEEVIRRGTEIGVTTFRFWRATRSEAVPRVRDKWERLAVESCKQCGRLWLPAFETADDLREALDTLSAPDCRLIATGDASPQPLREAVQGAHAELIIGPEGDFTPQEIAVAQKRGAVPISLGPHTFRSEVAAVVGATLVLYELGALGEW